METSIRVGQLYGALVLVRSTVHPSCSNGMEGEAHDGSSVVGKSEIIKVPRSS